MDTSEYFELIIDIIDMYDRTIYYGLLFGYINF